MRVIPNTASGGQASYPMHKEQYKRRQETIKRRRGYRSPYYRDIPSDLGRCKDGRTSSFRPREKIFLSRTASLLEKQTDLPNRPRNEINPDREASKSVVIAEPGGAGGNAEGIVAQGCYKYRGLGP